MSPEDKVILRTERLKAHAKMRDEIRNAVKEEILRDGISREGIRKAMADIAREETAKAIKNNGGIALDKMLTDLLKGELERVCGKGYLTQHVKDRVGSEVSLLAKEFVNNKVIIKSLDDGGTW